MSSIAPRNSPISSSYADLSTFPPLEEKAPGTEREVVRNQYWLGLSNPAPGTEVEQRLKNLCPHTYD